MPHPKTYCQKDNFVNTIIKVWAKMVIKGRWFILALFTIAIGLAIRPMGQIDYDNSNERFFIAGDENLTNFDTLVDLFGDIDYLSIGIEA